MSKTTKTIIISAFPGSGKTTFAKKFKGRVLDLESSDFKWKGDTDVDKVLNQDFPRNYIDTIIDAVKSEKYGAIIVSNEFLNFEESKELSDMVENIIAIYPLNDKETGDSRDEYYNDEIKNEFLNRYKTMGKPDSFIKFISDNWDKLISDMENSTIPTKHITLQGNVSGISNLCVQLLSGFETALSSTYNDDESVYQVNSFCTYFRSFGESDGYERAFSLTYEDALQLLPKDKEDYNYSIKRFSIPKEEKLRLMEIVKDKNSAVSIKAVIDYGFKEVEKVFKSSRDAGEYEDKTGIVAKPIKVNPNGYNEDKKPLESSKEIDDFIKGAIKDMNNLMTQEAHSTEDKKVTVMDYSVDDEKDKPISTPEEFINYVEGLFEI